MQKLLALDVGFLASRNVKKQISVVRGPQSVIFCYDSLSRGIQSQKCQTREEQKESGHCPSRGGSNSCCQLQRGMQPLSVSLSRMAQPWALHTLIVCALSCFEVLKTRHIPIISWGLSTKVVIGPLWPLQPLDSTYRKDAHSDSSLNVFQWDFHLLKKFLVGFLNCKIRNLLLPERGAKMG